MNTPSVLIISFSYWPAINARAFRWTALAEHWCAKGIDVQVVTAWMPGRPCFEVRNGVRIHRAGYRSIERLRSWLASRRSPSAPTLGARPPDAASDGSAARFAGKLARSLWRGFYWPDTSCLWFGPAQRIARRLVRQARPAAVIGVSPTYTAVAVARSLCRNLRDTPLLIDLGDPFSLAEEAPPNNFTIYRGLNRRLERACLARAQVVCVTTPGTRDLYAGAFPEAAGKVQVVAPLLSLPELPAARPITNPPQWVFVGTLYRSIRRPDFLLELFCATRKQAGLNDLELHFYGDASDCADSFRPYADLVGRAIFLHGSVPRSQAMEAMAAATLLVNLGNDTAYQLPSKLLEYVAVGRPILNVATHPRDSSASFLTPYPLGITMAEPRAGTAPTLLQVEAVQSLMSRSTEGPPTAAIESLLAPSRLEAISATYLELLGIGGADR